jgi:proteasome lid subunit RPN8/RPN11
LELVREGRLRKNETVRCLFTASFDEAHAGAGPAPRFTVRERPPEVSIAESRWSDISGVRPSASGPAYPVDYPIVIPRGILDETRRLVSASRPNESGGILVGRLHRDVESRDIFAEVTAHIPAEHTTSTPERLTFTVDTWTAAREVLESRRRGEVFLGWYHFHPAPGDCASCPDERRSLCALTQGFLSSDDLELHRVVFPRAYSFALVFSPRVGGDVVGREPPAEEPQFNPRAEGEVEHTLFGWRRGVLERRDFLVTGTAGDDRAPDDATVTERSGTGGNERVTDGPSETQR